MSRSRSKEAGRKGRASNDFLSDPRRFKTIDKEENVPIQGLIQAARKNSLSRYESRSVDDLLLSRSGASQNCREPRHNSASESGDELDSLPVSSQPSISSFAGLAANRPSRRIPDKTLEIFRTIKPNGAIEVLSITDSRYMYPRDLKVRNMKIPTASLGSFLSSAINDEKQVDSLIEEWVRRVQEEMPDVKIIRYEEVNLGHHDRRRRSPRESCWLRFKGWVSQRFSRVRREGIWGDQSLAKSAKAFHNDTAFKRFRRNLRQLFVEE
jgi:hypothetical protein